MAYSTSNPPAMVSGTNSHRNWVYKSTDAAAVVIVAGYITDADALGMQVGDTVTIIDTDSNPVDVTLSNVVSVTAGGGADLSTGTAITATNLT